MSSSLDDLLQQIPISDIAKQVGIDPAVAESAVNQILPTLIGGMAVNAQDSEGEASLSKALQSHNGTLASRRSVSNIDTEDGEKIVSHVFGAKKDDVVTAVSSTKGVGKDIIAKILPIVAPIVLAWLANKFLSGKKDETASNAGSTSAAPSSGGLGDLLGGLLGGGGSGGGDLLGGLLGGILGGKK
jgi:hypothetical protein